MSYSLFVETCGAHTLLGPVVLVCRAIVHQSVCTCTEEPGVSRGLESKHILIFFCKMALGRAEQNCTLCVHVISCLYCTVQLPGATLLKALCYEMRRSSMFSKAEELQNWLHTRRRRSTAQVTYRALGCARAKNQVVFHFHFV